MTPDQIEDAMRANWGPKSVAEIVHEFACIRGDLVEQSGRDALTRIIEWKVQSAECEVAHLRRVITLAGDERIDLAAAVQRVAELADYFTSKAEHRYVAERIRCALKGTEGVES